MTIRKQGMEQGTSKAASPSPQSAEVSQSSHPEFTHPRPDATASTVEVPRKSAASSKLSISALRIARQDSDPTSEGSRGQAVVTIMGNGTGETSTLWETKSSEERRQRGLSGEGSTSHSLATSPSDSPAITPPVSSSPLHHKQVLFIPFIGGVFVGFFYWTQVAWIYLL
jgi:hypothetical protein